MQNFLPFFCIFAIVLLSVLSATNITCLCTAISKTYIAFLRIICIKRYLVNKTAFLEKPERCTVNPKMLEALWDVCLKSIFSDSHPDLTGQSGFFSTLSFFIFAEILIQRIYQANSFIEPAGSIAKF